MNIRLAVPVEADNIVNGPGLRTTIFCQGCLQRCEGCFSPGTHALNGGFLGDTKEIIEYIKNTKLQRGISILGGEPFLQVTPLIEICKEVKKLDMDIWIYTGYSFEYLIRKSLCKKLLNQADILVDGKFEKNKRNYDLLFKGSSNQRIIDIQKSFIRNEIVIAKEYERSLLVC